MRTPLLRSSRSIGPVLLVLLGMLALPLAQGRRTLDIYVVDVEGGNATLYVPPSGESVLIDTGNGGNAGARDPDRIMAAIKDAGLTQIDHVITTHWHGDHFGGMEQLAKMIPIKDYVDHGPTVEPQPASTAFLDNVYPKLFGAAKHTVVKPGDKLTVAGLDWRIVTANGDVIKTALPGGGAPNKSCATYKPQDPDPTENARSVGSVIGFGKFRVAQLGDLTWNKEHDLMCPNNRIGTVDLYVVSHHGLNVSNSEVLVHGLQSRVMIMNNGTRKGGFPEVMRTLYSAPHLEDVYQMHFSVLSGQEYTVPGMFIANTVDDQPASMPIAAEPAPTGRGGPPPPIHNGRAYWFKVSANGDGSFTVTNARNGFSKSYAAR